jgi:putative hydrolase of the HAD superfamily
MVGNSVRSDIIPVVELGARAVHVPYHVTWALEEADASTLPADRWARIDDLSVLDAVLDRFSRAAG